MPSSSICILSPNHRQGGLSEYVMMTFVILFECINLEGIVPTLM